MLLKNYVFGDKCFSSDSDGMLFTVLKLYAIHWTVTVCYLMHYKLYARPNTLSDIA